MITVILPAYNEGKILRRNVSELERVLEGQLKSFEIIISEDGSTDDTVAVAKELENGRIRLLEGSFRLGKGAAIKRAVTYAKGDVIIFMDADLASDPSQVKELTHHIENGADIVIGSRYLRGSKATRNIIRYIASRSYNFLVRLLLGSKLSDHQCGFKCFKKRAAIPIIKKVDNNQWFWDTEFLVRAQHAGLRIVETPIQWEESPTSQFHLIRDAYTMGKNLILFKLKGES